MTAGFSFVDVNRFSTSDEPDDSALVLQYKFLQQDVERGSGNTEQILGGSYIVISVCQSTKNGLAFGVLAHLLEIEWACLRLSWA